MSVKNWLKDTMTHKTGGRFFIKEAELQRQGELIHSISGNTGKNTCQMWLVKMKEFFVQSGLVAYGMQRDNQITIS